MGIFKSVYQVFQCIQLRLAVVRVECPLDLPWDLPGGLLECTSGYVWVGHGGVALESVPGPSPLPLGSALLYPLSWHLCHGIQYLAYGLTSMEL